MKTALVWTLMALVPFVNLQMICVDHPGDRAVLEAGSSSDPNCMDFCLRTQKPKAPVKAEGGCVLIAGGCSVLAALVVALPEPSPSLAAPVGHAVADMPLRHPRYLSPALQKRTPPPKS